MTQNPQDAPGERPVTPPPPPPTLTSLPIEAVDALLSFGDLVPHQTRFDDLVQRVVDTAVHLVAVPWAVLLLRDPQTRELRLVASHGIGLDDLPPVLQLPSEAHVNPALFQGAALVLEDYAGGPPLSPVWWEPARRLGLRAVLAVPLVAAGEYVGSLHVAGPQPHRFTDIERALIDRLARLAGQLLVQNRALSAAQARAGALETMQAVARSLEATLDLETVLQILVDRSVALSGATGGFLMLWDEAAQTLVMRKLVNATEFERQPIGRGEGITGTAFLTATPQWHNTYQHFASAVPLATQERVTNALAVPLLREGRPFGTITVFSKVLRAFTAEDAHVLALFASQAAVAIDNGLLYTTVARQQRQLDSIIRTLPDGLIVYDRAGAVVLINPAAEEMLGVRTNVRGVLPEARLQQPEQYMRYRAETLHDWVQTFATVLEKGVTLAGMTRIHAEPVRTVESFYAPYLDESGAIIGVIAAFRDISATQELERVRAELDVARQQDDFLSIASHELRTPITAIKGFSDLLSRRLVPGATVSARDAQMLGSLSAQVVRLAALVTDLLDVGRIHAGKIDFHWECCGVRAVVQAALDGVRPVAGPREGDLALAGTDGTVRCDAARLEQVFVNLLTNALKYSAAGPITCTITRTGAEVCVAVADHGQGIAAADLPRVFERFYRSHDVYTHQRGLGLGLYISREIVARHGGRLWVESTLGKGSTFFVALPLAEDT